MKVIELIGIPGSGKTHLYPDILKTLNEKRYDIKDLIILYMVEKKSYLKFLKIFPNKIFSKIIIKLYYNLKYDKKNQAIFQEQEKDFFYFIKMYNSSRPISADHKEKILEWFLVTGELYILARSVKTQGFFLISEGFIQRVSSLFVSELEEEIDFKLIEKYLDLIPLSSEAIFINRDFDKCYTARLKDPGFRLKEKSSENIKKILKYNLERLFFSFNYIKAKNIKTRIIDN